MSYTKEQGVACSEKNPPGISQWMAGLSLFNYARGLLASHVQRDSALSSMKEAYALLEKCAVRLRSVFPARHALVVLSYLNRAGVFADFHLLVQLAGMECEATFGVLVSRASFDDSRKLLLGTWTDLVKRCVEVCGASALREFRSRFFSEIHDFIFAFMWEFMIALFTDDWSSDELLRMALDFPVSRYQSFLSFFCQYVGVKSHDPLDVVGAIVRNAMRGRATLPNGFRPQHNVFLRSLEGITPLLDFEEWPIGDVSSLRFKDTENHLYAWMKGHEFTSLRRLRIHNLCLSDFVFEDVRAPNLEKLIVVSGTVIKLSNAAIAQMACEKFRSIRCVELIGGRSDTELGPLQQIPGLRELRLVCCAVEYDELENLLELGRLSLLQLLECSVSIPPVQNVVCDSGHAVALKIPYADVRGDWSCDVCDFGVPSFFFFFQILLVTLKQGALDDEIISL